MENLNPTMITLAALGMLIHALMFVLQYTNKKNKFSFKIWFADKMNWIRIILAMASTVAILLMIDDIAAYFGMTIEGHGSVLKLIAFTAGYLNHSLIKNVLRTFKKKVDNSNDTEN